MTTAALARRVADERGSPRQSAAGEAARRIGLALAGLILPLVGALIAALVSHPNRLFAIGAGVIPCALAYFPAMIACQGLAESGTLAPGAAAVLPVLLMAAIGAGVLRLHWRSGWA
jgi:lipopolysaccharide export LptBFGC system permease protein LptF